MTYHILHASQGMALVLSVLLGPAEEHLDIVVLLKLAEVWVRLILLLPLLRPNQGVAGPCHTSLAIAYLGNTYG